MKGKSREFLFKCEMCRCTFKREVKSDPIPDLTHPQYRFCCRLCFSDCMQMVALADQIDSQNQRRK